MSEHQSLLAKILIGEFLGPTSAVSSLAFQIFVSKVRSYLCVDFD